MKTAPVLLAALITFSSESLRAQLVRDSVTQKTDFPLSVFDSMQVEKSSTKISHFEAGINYQSNNVYLGRKDSAVLPYYIPSISFYHKSGVYATASLDYLKNTTDSRIDAVTLEAGYLISSGKYDGQFSISRLFYNSQSTNVTSELKASMATENSYDLGCLKATFTGTLNLGSKTDIAGLFGLEHTFSVFNDQLNFTPTLAATASTQNYYNDYYRKRRYTIKRKGQKVQAGMATITGTVLNASAFKLLDYEPTMPINYIIGKCTLNFTPTFAIPVHPSQVANHIERSNGTNFDKLKTEKIENTFYWSLGVSFQF